MQPFSIHYSHRHIPKAVAARINSGNNLPKFENAIAPTTSEDHRGMKRRAEEWPPRKQGRCIQVPSTVPSIFELSSAMPEDYSYYH
jgi:hypothetical protein